MGLDGTHNVANLVGLMAKIGMSVKHITNIAKAAKLSPPKMSRRSHLLTI